MYRIFLIIFLVLVLLLSSCGKQESEKARGEDMECMEDTVDYDQPLIDSISADTTIIDDVDEDVEN